MVAVNRQRITPRDVAGVLFRRWLMGGLVFGLILSATLLALILCPRSYESEAKLFLRVGRESVTLDPTATTGQTIMMQKFQDAEVVAALDVLNSAAVHRRVAEAVGLDRILATKPESASPSPGGRQSKAPSWWASAVDAALKKLRLSEPGTDLDLALRRLQRGVHASAAKNSTVITVKYAAITPELAREVVATLTDVFIEEHMRVNRTDGSQRFFLEQERTLAAQLEKAQETLRDFKNEHEIASTSRQQAILQEQIKNVELEMLRVNRELSSSHAQIANLSRQIADLDPEIVTLRLGGVANEAKDAMRAKLYELELKEARLLAQYTIDHPYVMAVQQEREAAEKILSELPDDRTHTTEALNSNQRKLELQLMEARSNQKAQLALRTTTSQQRDNLVQRLQSLNDQEVTLAQLERDVTLLEEKHRMHAAKLEEARVTDALQQEQITNVNVVQPATLVHKPAWPNKRLFFMLGVVLATSAGIASMVAAEVCDQKLRTTSRVESMLGLPVLLSLPRRRRRRRRAMFRARDAIAALAHRATTPAHGGRARRKAARFAPLVNELVRKTQTSGRRSRFVGIVGCQAERFRSQVAAELAIHATAAGSRDVLLIDADERHRRVARRFDLNGSPGFREVLAGVVAADSCIHRPRNGDLAVMTCGGGKSVAVAPAPTRTSRDPVDGLAKDFRLVIVDLPATGELDWHWPVSEWVDDVVLVVDAERTRIQSAQSLVKRLERSGVRVLGAVVANRRDYVPGWLYRRL